jgi:nitrate reductase (NAD(P)H)
MPAPPATTATVTSHPGSTADEISQEPEWGAGHQHRIGFVNRSGRLAGFTHDGDHAEDDDQDERKFEEEAQRKYRDLRTKEGRGDLVNFEDVMKDQTVGATLLCEPCDRR